MAAGASAAAGAAAASVSFYTPHRLIFSSFSSKCIQTHFSLKAISIRGIPLSLGQSNNPIINRYGSRSSRKRRFLKASLSSEDSASQADKPFE